MVRRAMDATPLPLEAAVAALDSEGMFGYVAGFVDDLEAALSSVDEDAVPWLSSIREQPWSGLLCLGMGGSGAGGAFLASLAAHKGSIPIVAHSDARLPSWADERWLVMATSYSGNTAETLAAVREALDRGMTVLVLSSGGELAGMAETNEGMHLIGVPSGQPPRSAFGHLFGRQLAVARSLGLLPNDGGNDEAMLARLRAASMGHDPRATPSGGVDELAMELLERPVALLGPTELAPVLTRFKNQLNENAGRFARIGVVPEMNHNEVVAWGGPGWFSDPFSDTHAVLVLTWPGMQPEVKARIDWGVKHLRTQAAWVLQGEGASLLEVMLHHCVVMDWISVTLAVRGGKNPTSIGPIDGLKEHLARLQ